MRAAGIAIMEWLARKDPALLAARMNVKAQEGQPFWDRIVLIAARLIYWSWLILMGLDGGRYHWSALPRRWLIWVGRAGLLAGIWGIYRRLPRENSFGAPKNIVPYPGRARPARHHDRTLRHRPPPDVRRGADHAGRLGPGAELGLGRAGRALHRIPDRASDRRRGKRCCARACRSYVEYTRTVRWRLIPYVW